MLKIYGSMQCPDCQKCREDLDRANVAYEYLDFSVSLRNLKEFLVIREGSDAFAEVKQKGSIGIPCLVEEDGAVSLSWDKYL